MSGVEFRDGTLVVDREPNDLDTLALTVSSIFDDLDIRHVFVAGYVAILAGRARATQDIDVLLEPLEEETIEQLRTELFESGFWGPAMPLSEMEQSFEHGDHIWVARDDEMIPHLEVKYVSDEFDRASLRHSITARIGDQSLPVGPFELQIAYKLYLGTRKDFEDAVHLYTVFEENLRVGELETWVDKLEVDTEYDELKRAS